MTGPGVLGFVVDFLSVPALLVSIIVFIGYLAIKGKTFSDALAGGLKAAIGFFILTAGAATLTGSLDVLGPMITEAFNVQGVVPNNEAITAIAVSVAAVGRAAAIIMVLGFVFNILLHASLP